MVGLAVAVPVALLLAPTHEAGAQVSPKVAPPSFAPKAPAAAVADLAPPPGTLAGEYAFRNAVTNEYLSVYGGTLRATKAVGANERFRMSEIAGDTLKPKRIQIATGGFVTAAGATPPAIAFSRSMADDTLFTFVGGQDTYAGTYAPFSKKASTYAIAQPGMIGKPADAVVLSNFGDYARRYYWVIKCGELAPGRYYSIRVPGTKTVIRKSSLFVRQPDGSYAIDATTGDKHFFSARDGGGLSPLHDPIEWRETVRAGETWKLVDQGDCTYALQTSKGWHLGVKADEPGNWTKITTRISEPNAAASIGYLAKFELIAHNL